MRVGLVSAYMPPHVGGIEAIAESFFQGYQRLGLDVRWVASRAPAPAAPREGARHRVPCVNVIENVLGVPVPVWGAAAWRELNGVARWADVLHVIECLYTSSLMAAVVARRRKKPLLLSQNVGFIRYRVELINWTERLAYATLGRWVLANADHLVLASPAAEQFIPTVVPLDPSRTSCVPVGIDSSRFQPASPQERLAARARLDLTSGDRIVLFAGRLVEKKGLPIVLAAAAALPQTCFVVAGDGPLRSLMSAAPRNVVWRSDVTAERMPDYYRAADCVVLPSHGEGLPLVVQETLASGLPCLVSDDEVFAVPLIRERVCVPVRREGAAVAATIADVLAADTSALRARARAFATRCWDVDGMVEAHARLLRRVCEERAGSTPARASDAGVR